MYKVGDTVLIRKDLKAGENYGMYLSIAMSGYAGEETKVVGMRITPSGKKAYYLDIDKGNFMWTSEMLEPKLDNNFEKAKSKHEELLKERCEKGRKSVGRNMNKLEKILELSKSKGFESLHEECNTQCWDCEGCSFFRVMKHDNCNIEECAEQLLEPYEEPRKLTKRERAFCEVLKRGYIARNKNGLIHIYDLKPIKVFEKWGRPRYGNKFRIDDDLFMPILWEDEEPYSVEELLKWEVEK